MKKYILAIALIAVVATTINLSLKTKNIDPTDLVAAAVARPGNKTQEAPVDVKGGDAQVGDRQSVEWQPGWSKGCIKKQACDYVGDKEVREGAKQGDKCVYQAYLAKVGKDRLGEMKKTMYPTKPEPDFVSYCGKDDKNCVPLYEMQTVEAYKSPDYKQVFSAASVYKVAGYVPKADLSKYDGAKACNWRSFAELEKEAGSGPLTDTLKDFTNGRDVTGKYRDPNSKDNPRNFGR